MSDKDEVSPVEKKLAENQEILSSAQTDLQKLRDILPEDNTKAEGESNFKQNSDISKGLGIVSQIISGMFVGIALGYGIDTLLGTKPWGMVILIPLGFVAGFVNMVRFLNQEEKKSVKVLDKNSKND